MILLVLLTEYKRSTLFNFHSLKKTQLLMEPKELAKLTNEELLQEQKKTNSNKIIHAVLIGVLVGVSIFSTVKKGFGFFTFFPLFFVFLLLKKQKDIKGFESELESELRSRNLK